MTTNQVNARKANQEGSAPMMPYKAFGEAVKLARKKIEENPGIADSPDLVVYLEFELDKRFALSVGQLAKIPAAIKIALLEIEKVAHAEEEISLQTPGLEFPSGSSFPSGSITFTNGRAISDKIIKEARERVCSTRQEEFSKFLRDKKVFTDHVRSLIEEQYPGYGWIDKEKFLNEELLYHGRVISRGEKRQCAIKSIVEQVIRERRIVKERMKAESEWHRKAVAHVTEMTVTEIRNGNKAFSKAAMVKKMAKADFAGKPFPKDVVDEGIKRGQAVCQIDNGTFQRPTVIKKASAN
jgi:hypothetical protein